SYATLNWATKGVITDNGGTFPLFTANSDLTIPSTAYYFANTPRTFDDVTVAGVLTHSNNYDTQLNILDITAQNVTVLAAGKIDVSSRGYYSSLGLGAGNDSTLSTTGEGGGGHGGSGGNGSTNTGGSTYGSLAEPLTLGSGGGFGYVSSSDYEPGGSGGGVLRLSVTQTLNLEGPLLANGETKSGCSRCGGGAGGSVYLTAATISGTSNISAQGGGGEPSFGGGGGGGRIALYYTDNTNSGTVSVLGGSGFQSGQAGTKVVKALGGELISSPYDTADPATVLSALTWSESRPANTAVKFQLRTSPDSDGTPSSWSSWLGPSGVDSYYTSSSGGDAINPIHSDAEDDQWVQYKVIFSRNYDVDSSPTISQVGLEYVVNTPPTVTLSNSPQQSESGVITAQYSLTDPEESSLDVFMAVNIGHSLASDLPKGSTLPVSVPSTTGFPASGTLLVNNEMVGYSGISATQFLNITRAKFTTKNTAQAAGSPLWYVAQTTTGDYDSVSTGSSKSISWTPRTELTGFENNTSQVKVIANDGNSANQIGFVVSGVIGLDTKAPINNDLFINSRTDVLTFSSTDGNSLKMKLSNLSSLNSDGVNASSGTWLDYQSTLPWIIPDSETVYVKFKDIRGNETSTVSTTAPTHPSSVLIQDASNPETESWRLFVSWSLGPDPSLGFNYYQIYRSLNNQTYAPLDQINQESQNFFLNSGLDNSQAYYYKVTIVDDHGNESGYNTVSQVAGSASKSGVGLTPDGSGGGDYTAPVISGLGSTSLTSTSATITWTTDELADSKVGYSTDSGYGLEVGTISMTQNHSVTLTGLTPETKYYFRAISYDSVFNKTIKENSSLYFFTTLSDSELPVISQVKAVVGENSAGITWATSEAATSRVVYSLGSSSVATSSADLVLGHSLSIVDLLSATLYHYFVSSSDAEGNQSTSPDYTFTTLAGPEAGDNTAPSITDISVSDTTASSTSVSWKTNEVADGRVEYGETESYERGIAEGNHDFKTEKKVVLLGLSPSTTYHYRITAIDTAGNINTSADSTFTTGSTQILGDLTENGTTGGANAPAITSEGASVTNITGTQATLSWITSKKSTSQVYYKINNSLGVPISGGDATQFVTSHSVTLSNLSPATTYQYQVKSTDVNGNYIISARAVFTTVMPEAAAVKVSNVTQNSAQIVWTSPIPTLSIIEYINSLTGQKQIYEDKSLVTNHSVALADLSSSTIYSFTILIKDESGNLARSTPFSFTTGQDGDGPQITAVNSHSTIISGQNKVQTVITWSTNEPASSKVDYSLNGTGTNFELSSPQTTDLVTNHIIVLTNLKPATVYRFRVVSTDRTGNVTTSEPYVLLSPQREVSALDLIIKNLEGAFGWARALNGTP
ncbi:MAG: fibronectin type III domain-containing protein, partial [Candidatus Shapirobacteria bacterium]